MSGTSRPFSTDSSTEISRLEAALHAAGIGTWELDRDELRICSRFRRLTGINEDILTLEDFLQIVDPYYRNTVRDTLRSAQHAASDGVIEIAFLKPMQSSDEPDCWLQLKGQAATSADTGYRKLSGILQNVTQNTTITQQLHESEAHYRSLAENTPDLVTRWDKDLRLVFANPAFSSKVGQPADELLGKTGAELGKQEYIPLPSKELLRKIFETGAQRNYYNYFISPQAEIHYHSRVVPEFGQKQEVDSILAISRDITELRASEALLKLMIDQAPVATALYLGRELRIELANDIMIGYWGKDRSVIGRPFAEAVPELNGQEFFALLDEVFTTGKTYESHSTPAQLKVNGHLDTFYFDFTYQALRNARGEIYAIMHMAVDVTQQVLALHALKASDSNLRAVIAAAPVAIGLFVGRDLVIEMPNEAFLKIVGKGDDIAGKPLRQVMPELEGQPYLQILDDVYTSGQMYQSFAAPVAIVQQGVLTENFYNISYTPLLDADGQVFAILDIAIDVTERILAQKETEESQMQLLALFEQSPVAIALVGAENLTLKMVNPFFAELAGQQVEAMQGRPIHEALPAFEDQGFNRLLNYVIETGMPYNSTEVAFFVPQDGDQREVYLDLTFQPQKQRDGKIVGALIVATDVSGQVLARKQIQETESNLRSAVDLAELGTWNLDIRSRQLEFSSRLCSWFGIKDGEPVTLEQAFRAIKPMERRKINRAMLAALKADTDGIINMEFTLDPKVAGVERVLNAQGKVFFKDGKKAYKVSGTVQDVTKERKVQFSLEHQVQMRTEELEAANEELASTNEELASTIEELAATNHELSVSNQQLSLSNDNLEQFSYVASHDLQEPLRKIQSFGNLLEIRYGGQLGEGSDYLHRMQSAAGRMSLLIEDLLSFSRITSKQLANAPISLTDVLNQTLLDLELTIQETGAVVQYGSLPTVFGDTSQLGQLFTNLLSNAIKFHREGVVPIIEVSYQTLTAATLPEHVKPTLNAPLFYQIDVKDNGIGFDQKYASRIFQVFQRLHGKKEFLGTGIGLAICEKVATNHGGAITAHGTPGKGATFSIFLPA